MDFIIDFHDYLIDNDQIMVKELAIISLQSDTNELPTQYQNEFLNRQKIYGIPWDLGYTKTDLLYSILNKLFRKAQCIFVANERAKRRLIEIIGNTNIPIIPFNDNFGTLFKYRTSTGCLHHENREKNNCAYDNIKELAIVSLQPNSNGEFIDSHYVFKPPYSWEQLPKKYRDDYLYRYEVYGIPWQLGHTSANSQESILMKHLYQARRVFVCESKTKHLLLQIIGNVDIPILYLDDDDDDDEDIVFDYEFETKCLHHQNRSENNCVYDNVISLKNILLSK
ncbi:hypothetical protein KQX54_007816 [Cotesia glomerata]|uniref:Uncharacterized protein n=1 Tax=Cotesia glomerata TaxID=32391 RepID=A0AAV7IQS2_COTGL|nr:hypothetical protein KQX54_007816 [Cotesia glomerata]